MINTIAFLLKVETVTNNPKSVSVLDGFSQLYVSKIIKVASWCLRLSDLSNI